MSVFLFLYARLPVPAFRSLLAFFIFVCGALASSQSEETSINHPQNYWRVGFFFFLLACALPGICFAAVCGCLPSAPGAVFDREAYAVSVRVPLRVLAVRLEKINHSAARFVRQIKKFKCARR